MSLRASAASPLTCSGDMYPTVPGTDPASVCKEATAVGAEVAPAEGEASERARPKSRIFTRPADVRKTLSGFRSRCTIPFACAAEREPIGHRNTDLDGLSPGQTLSREPLAQRLAVEQLGDGEADSPCLADVVDRENVRVDDAATAASASRSNRASAFGSTATGSGRTLIATSRSRRVSRAR